MWGPHSEPLDKNAWRLTVTRVEPHVFSWTLDGKPKAADDSAFVTILSGTHTRAVNATAARSRTTAAARSSIDWDAAQTLPEHDNAVGVATFTYSRVAPGAVTTIDVDFKASRTTRPTEIYNAMYRYTATPGAGGDCATPRSRTTSPIRATPATAKEDFTIHSRWMESGAGRTDYRITGGDVTAALAGPATASRVLGRGLRLDVQELVVQSDDPARSWGAETSCAFATADFSSEAP